MVGVGKHQTMKMQVHVMGNLSTLLLLLPINMFMCFVARLFFQQCCGCYMLQLHLFICHFIVFVMYQLNSFSTDWIC
jgi:hypothetical protein